MHLRFMVFLYIVSAILTSCSYPNEQITSNHILSQSDSTTLVRFFSAALQSPQPNLHLDSARSFLQQSDKQFPIIDFFLVQQATFYLKSGQFDLAMQEAQRGIDLSQNIDSTKQGKFYNIQGHVFSFKRDNTRAINSFRKALAIFESNKDSLNIAYINNNIANIFFSLSDYNSAYTHAAKAFEIIQDYPENQYYASMLSVLAISEAFIGKTDEAEQHANAALQLTKGTANIIPYALSLYALGDIATARESFDTAKKYYNESLTICQSYNLTPYVLINKTALLNAHVRFQSFNQALKFGTEALMLSEMTKNENIQLSIHKNMAKAYQGSGKNDSAMHHMSIAYALKEEISSKENKKIIHDLLIQYETEKKDKLLSENKLKLLEDQAIIDRGKFYITILIVSLIGLSGFIYLFVKSRKQEVLRLQQEKETELVKANLLGEQRERIRLSRELHDGIASELLGLKIKAQDSSADPHWIHQLSSIHQEVRRISHNLAPFKVEQFGLKEALRIFCLENTDTRTQIHFYANDDKDLDSSTEQIIYRCAQELIQNALKYAQCSEIDVQLFFDSNIRLTVEDNGKGIPEVLSKLLSEKIKKQWALSNRLEDVYIESQINNGTTVQLTFNYSS